MASTIRFDKNYKGSSNNYVDRLFCSVIGACEEEGTQSPNKTNMFCFNYMEDEEKGREDEDAVQQFLERIMKASFPGLYCQSLINLIEHQTAPLYIRVWFIADPKGVQISIFVAFSFMQYVTDA